MTGTTFDAAFDFAGQVAIVTGGASGIGHAVASALAERGATLVLIDKAGIVRLAPAETLSAADWDATLAVNLKAPFMMCQLVGRRMLERGRGRIVNIASKAAIVALDQHVAYCARKAATGRFARSDEIALAALFLLSGAAAMINGENLVGDGSYTIQ